MAYVLRSNPIPRQPYTETVTNQHSRNAQTQPAQTLPLSLIAGLALLSAAAPFGADTYLASFVEIAKEFSTTESIVQLTLTTFMIGMAAGQLVIGALSDSLGRRKLLLIATLVFLGSSILCAIAPNIGTLIAMRLFQGLAGGSTVVLARAVVPDLLTGKASARAFSTLMGISSIAPAIAPLVGGFLGPAFGWRSVFWFLAAINVAMVAIVVLMVPETLPPERRSTGSLRNLLPNIGRLLQRPVFVGYLLAFAGGFSVMFSYIAASPFIFQELLGLTPTQFSLVFASNAAMLTFVSILNGKMINRLHPRKGILVALTVMLVTSIGLIVNAIVGITFFTTWLLLFITVPMMPLIFANATALGIEEVRDIGIGSGSGLMGFTQFLAAATVSPLVGLGSNLPLSMAISMLTCALIALIAVLTLTRDGLRKHPHKLA